MKQFLLVGAVAISTLFGAAAEAAPVTGPAAIEAAQGTVVQKVWGHGGYGHGGYGHGYYGHVGQRLVLLASLPLRLAISGRRRPLRGVPTD